ncbi:MAG TPA: PHB depolymerase family esterase [Noviherbaspirillum sp.]|uniref:extracellular catalytic domain type 2 short-chain-length polyhydroxyalkanoate depolymerase n=1 Tax=Noviherbaspirillum sp. TaxID=1926288 RepID=UPI002D590A93|nr:PHB depolymerase family esterase [Noviherbaspirillum sp.]HYD95416.1 PHB depolymerase family esterase [Noviherbaspirillum sp.]
MTSRLHAAPVSLQNFNVDIAQTSVSGLSSGGFMAVQFSVAYSSIIRGAGIVAGGPYYCAQGDTETATRRCSCSGFNLTSSCEVAPGSTNVDKLVEITGRRAQGGAIDATAYLANQRIWLFSGQQDSIVPPPVMQDLYNYYRNYVGEAAIRFRKDINAEHAFPTESYGNPCTALGKPYINNCGFDAAGELLKWIYGDNLRTRNTNGLGGRLVEFDQTEFFPDRRPRRHGMADIGYAYIPASCDKSMNQPCRVHVAFHGCRQNADSIDDVFIRNAGYNPWADTNNIIVLYPQTASTFGRNPNACWNWFDFNRDDPDYANKNGRQMAAIKAMIDRVAGLTTPPDPAPRCFTASNAEHVFAGRAHDWFFLALANGSNKFMGLNNFFTLTTLKQTGPNYYVVGNCL